jgi:predicted  nucleic acid-binding Zn-ribbon protein
VFAVLEKLTLVEAGQALGISPDAVRMRIKRGSMQAEKGEDGRWLVWVDTEQAAAEREAEHEERELRELAARIGILEERLEELRQAREEIAELRQEIQATRDAVAATQDSVEQIGEWIRAKPQEARPWWARLWGK